MKITLTTLLLGAFLLSAYSQDYPDIFYNGEKYTLKSNILKGDADIFVYLPYNYSRDSLKTYPVHYVTDAPAVSNLYFDILNFQASSGSAPECIVVGLSGDDRNQNLLPGQGAGIFLTYMQKEVIPFIEDTYRTSSFRVLAGHSLGGDFVFYSLLTSPSLFGGYLAGSPGPIDLLTELFKKPSYAFDSPQGYRFLYTSTGSKDVLDTAMFRDFQHFFQGLTGGMPDAHFKVHPNEDHISNIAVNIQNGLRSLYSDWKFILPDANSLVSPTLILIEEHIKKVQEKFGEDAYIGDWEVFFPAMDQLAGARDFAGAVQVLELCIKYNPFSDQAYAFMAQAYFELKQYDRMKYFADRSLEINPRNRMARGLKSMALPN